jgi:hypothetical protein
MLVIPKTGNQSQEVKEGNCSNNLTTEALISKFYFLNLLMVSLQGKRLTQTSWTGWWSIKHGPNPKFIF